ncbi:MAG: hypothetical protein R3F33_05980 [Planctomycetota bacterium]
MVPALALCLAVPGLAGQQEESALDTQSLRTRDREVLHPGNPLVVSGVEQGDNNFRTVTPALVKADTTIETIDREELRARKLAMYQGNQRFDRAPLLTVRTSGSMTGFSPAALQEGRAIRNQELTKSEIPADGPGGTPYFLAAAGLLGLLLYKRSQQGKLV